MNLSVEQSICDSSLPWFRNTYSEDRLASQGPQIISAINMLYGCRVPEVNEPAKDIYLNIYSEFWHKCSRNHWNWKNFLFGNATIILWGVHQQTLCKTLTPSQYHHVRHCICTIRLLLEWCMLQPYAQLLVLHERSPRACSRGNLFRFYILQKCLAPGTLKAAAYSAFVPNLGSSLLFWKSTSITSGSTRINLFFNTSCIWSGLNISFQNWSKTDWAGHMWFPGLASKMNLQNIEKGQMIF